MPVPWPVPAPPPMPDPSESVGIGLPSIAPGSTCVPVAIVIAGMLMLCSTVGGSSLGGVGVTSGFFADGDRDLVLAGHLDLARRLLHLVAAATAAAAGAGYVQPDDVLAEPIGLDGRTDVGPRPVERHQDGEDRKRAVHADGTGERVAHLLGTALEGELQVGRADALDLERHVPGLVCGVRAGPSG